MAIYPNVDPATFIDPAQEKPARGRGCWTREGIGFDYRYALAPAGGERIGTLAHRSLAHWAVAAGAGAIQERLVELKYMGKVGENERGIFGPRTDAGVRAFQAQNVDPDSGAKLTVDGIVGRSDARALFTPIIDAAEAAHGIPGRLLRGECNHESALDPGAVGSFIYYATGTRYRGVDRGPFQINAEQNPKVAWPEAYDFYFAAAWSAKRMRGYFELFRERYYQDTDLLWDAAVLAHNNPAAAGRYAASGVIPSTSAAAYVAAVRAAIY